MTDNAKLYIKLYTRLGRTPYPAGVDKRPIDWLKKKDKCINSLIIQVLEW